MIRIEHLSKAYKVGTSPLRALCDVSIEIGGGELVAVIGSSGSGKSTLLNILGLLDTYDSGSYTLAGHLVKDLSETQAARFRNRHIGFVFQSFNLLPFKTAVENVALPLYYQGVPRRRRNARGLELLDRVGLAAWARHLPSQLSGGQQQRVAIARALCAQPKLILADEPTGALDSETSLQVMELLEELNAEGVTVVVVTHEAEIAARAGRVVRLRDGMVQAA